MLTQNLVSIIEPGGSLFSIFSTFNLPGNIIKSKSFLFFLRKIRRNHWIEMD